MVKKLNYGFIFSFNFTFSNFISFFILQSLKDNVIYFQSPSEIKSLVELNKKK